MYPFSEDWHSFQFKKHHGCKLAQRKSFNFDSSLVTNQYSALNWLNCMDFRYYTWRVIHALVQAKLDTSTKERKAYENLKGVSEEIVATRVYSLLCASPALAGNKKQRTSIEDAQNIQNGSEDGSEENALKSWCQSTEASRISNQSEGAQRRRKRRRLENDKVSPFFCSSLTSTVNGCLLQFSSKKVYPSFYISLEVAVHAHSSQPSFEECHHLAAGLFLLISRHANLLS